MLELSSRMTASLASSSEPESALPAPPCMRARVGQRAIGGRCVNWKGYASVVEEGAARAVR